MTQADATWQYMTGQMPDSVPALLEQFQRESDALPPDTADIAYGPHPRQTFDAYVSPAAWRGTMAYFHAGYWQARDKALFRFVAPALLQHGIDVALVNYPLCPDVTLPELVAAARDAVPGVLRHAAALGRGGTSLLAAGHSAGGHLAVELALTDWGGASPITGVAALSGVYDLEPLLATALNDKLRLAGPTARAMSPIHRVRGGLPPALFALGGDETPAFHAQTSAMHEAWGEAGNRSEHLVVAGADHFSLLRGFAPGQALLERVAALL